MALSRNKVAVSEGAAGSPPFYGARLPAPQGALGRRFEVDPARLRSGEEPEPSRLRTSTKGPNTVEGLMVLPGCRVNGRIAQLVRAQP